MLVTMKEMLADAKAKHYAIPAFDVSNYEMMRAVLDVCEEERSPALLMGLGVDLTGKGLNLITSMVRAASEFYTIPVCFHLDHATDFEFVKEAISAGFSSVMFDGSVLTFDENARKTAEITAYAHANGATVEAELGHVGNAMVGNENDNVKNEDPEEHGKGNENGGDHNAQKGAEFFTFDDDHAFLPFSVQSVTASSSVTARS